MEFKTINTAILGGSFDPVHLGHLFLLHSALNKTEYNKIILVPAKLSNFKQHSCPVATDVQRLEMLALALKDYEKLYGKDKDKSIIISDCELRRGGISYTSTTVEEIKKKYNLDKVGLIIGDDHLEKLSQWHNFNYLKDNSVFIICPRTANFDKWDTIPAGVNYIKLNIDNISPESSTSIRNNIGQYEHFLSEGVLKYVKANNLYS